MERNVDVSISMLILTGTIHDMRQEHGILHRVSSGPFGMTMSIDGGLCWAMLVGFQLVYFVDAGLD